MHSLLLLLSVMTRCLGQSPRVGESIYPYGLSVGDKETSRKDDGASPEIPISEHFTFFGKRYRSLYVNNNGVISFGVNVSEYTPDPFPLADGRPFVAPLWTDVDNSKSGHVYYRESTDPALLQKINKDMAVYFPNLHYKATWAFVATWDKVPYYKSSSNKTNTFQAILHTDTRRSFIMLIYGEITWTTGGASGGNLLTGLGGIPAQAGFNSGDKTHYFNIPGSRTDSILGINQTSNVNNPGCWVFQVDTFKAPGGCIYEANFARFNETFWKDESCENKCLCKTDGEITCSQESCPGFLVCQPSAWHFTCQIGLGTCF